MKKKVNKCNLSCNWMYLRMLPPSLSLADTFGASERKNNISENIQYYFRKSYEKREEKHALKLTANSVIKMLK